MDRLWDLFSTAGVAKTALLCGTLLIFVFGFLVWAAISQETIKLGWPTEISAPESEQLKACRAVQTALHDEIQTFDNDRTSSYKAIADDQNALNEATRLQNDTEREEVNSKESKSYYGAKVDIDSRIQQLNNDIDNRDEVISRIRQQIADRSQNVYSLCAVIIQAGR
jgi:hypothetical protein